MNIKLNAVIGDITGKTGSAILGVYVVAIPGISEIAALKILSETRTDLSKWPTRNRSVSWLNFYPNNKISDGKLISSQILKKKPNAAASAFRIAVNSMYRFFIGIVFSYYGAIIIIAREYTPQRLQSPHRKPDPDYNKYRRWHGYVLPTVARITAHHPQGMEHSPSVTDV